MKEIIIQIIKNNCYDVVGDDEIINSNNTVSYTHLTLPTKLEV